MSKRKICVVTGSRVEYDALKAEIEELKDKMNRVRAGGKAG